MLRRVPTAHFASHHSPTREQREVLFASTANTSTAPDAPDGSEGQKDEALELPEGVALTKRQLFHDAIFKAIDQEDQKQVLENPDFKKEIQRRIGSINEGNLDEVMQLSRMSIVDDLNLEQAERSELVNALHGLKLDDITESDLQEILRRHAHIINRYFKIPKTTSPHQVVDFLEAMLHQHLERMRKKDSLPQGIRWNFLYADQFEAEYRRLRKIPKGKEVRVPNAFSFGKIMYFNIEHEDFKDPNRRVILADRAVRHEATHLALKLSDSQHNLKQWTNVLQSHPQWQQLKQAVEAVFRNDPEYMAGESRKKNERIVNEALAIYMAHAPDSGTTGSEKPVQVYKLMHKILTHPHTGFLEMLKNNLYAKLNEVLETKERNGLPDSPRSVSRMLVEAAETSSLQQENLEAEVATNHDEGVGLAGTDMDLEGAEKKDIVTAESIKSRAKILYSKTQKILQEYPRLKGAVTAEQGISEEEKNRSLTVIDQNLSYFSEQTDDLMRFQNYADVLASWTKPPSEGGFTFEEKKKWAERMHFANNPYTGQSISMEDADRQTEGDRKDTLQKMHTALQGYSKVLEKIDKTMALSSQPEPAGAPEDSMWQWLKKNVFSSNESIVWMTPLNIINVIKIYKDAITQNYQSNQKVKENKFAKDINFYKPIEHTLKKLARSTNNTETSEFKEYIEKEGYTFDQVFGPDGQGLQSGLLFDNRHNFNRAKAVLEYAAEHAWLYFLDRGNGYNVYGIDFQGIEGLQSFEELVQKYESGKKRQIDHGEEKVSLDPDVVPIMEIMRHELHQKNIFAVQGIMQKLQNKAKYSHSNTWMLTTLLMYIRDHADSDPTLKLCLDKGMIDNISNHTIQQSAWSITWLKMLRHSIEDWKQGKVKFEEANVLMKTMKQIEDRILAAGAHFPHTDKGNMAKYEAIAFVLSGKTLSENNQEAVDRGLMNFGWKPGITISIFESEFTDYRNAFDEYTESASCDPGKTDPDYFNPKIGGSDVQLLTAGQFTKTLSRKSTGEWTDDERARGLVTQVLNRYDELAKIQPGALKNFHKEMQVKFDYWITKVVDKTRVDKVYQDVTFPTQSLNDSSVKSRSIIYELTRRGLFSNEALDVLKEMSDGLWTKNNMDVIKNEGNQRQ